MSDSQAAHAGEQRHKSACGLCGSFLRVGADKCPKCGAGFDFAPLPPPLQWNGAISTNGEYMITKARIRHGHEYETEHHLIRRADGKRLGIYGHRRDAQDAAQRDADRRVSA